MSSKLEDFKKEIKSAISSVGTRIIMAFWTAGFLFTMGAVPVNPKFGAWNTWEQTLYLLLRWLLWALELGDHYK